MQMRYIYRKDERKIDPSSEEKTRAKRKGNSCSISYAYARKVKRIA